MTKFRVTLNFSFERSDDYYDEYDVDEEDDSCANSIHDDEEKRKKRAFDRTEKYYEEHSLLDYIKSFEAYPFVEYIVADGEVLSAEWDPESFAIHMIVETDQSEEDLLSDLENFSLEDGEYEACGETGWIIMTRDEDGNPFGPPWDTRDFWEYGLTDYRHNPIKIVKFREPVSQHSEGKVETSLQVCV